VLAGIWQEVLGLERVGVLDNFFALGGDSIKSIQVLARANQEGLSFTLAELFAAQTVGELALVARRGEQEQVRRTEPWSLVSEEDRARMPEEIEDAYPLADLQAGMLFHSAYSPETAVYHDVFASRIRAELNEEVLRESVARLMARHAVLRTSFALSGYGEPLELVHREAAVPLEVVDLRELSSAEQDARLAAWLEAEKGRSFDWTAEKGRSFDWTCAPLFRLVVHRLGAEEFELALSFHHAILDGWSVATMLAELFGIDDSLARGEEVRLPSPGLAYRDFVALEREAIGSEDAKRYWEELLAGHTATRLPRLPGAKRTTGALGVAQREVPAELAVKLKGLAQQLGVPLKSLLLAAHLRVLAMVSGQREVLSGLVSNSRPEEAEGERVLGLFLNTLPLRLELADESWRQLVQRVFEAERAGLPHRRYPAGRLKRAEREELFETAFNYNHFHVYQGLEDRVQVSQPRMFEYTNFTLIASFQQSPDATRLEVTFNYDTGQLGAEQVSTIADRYLLVLEAMAEAPDERHEDCVLLSDAEREQLLLQWNRTEEDLPAERPVQALFSAHAAEHPSAPAVACGDVRWSYSELEERTNRLASYLAAEGVGPDVPVAVLIDRSPEMIAAILGVLKAGGAYLPLDPAYPRDRLEYMIQDSGAAMVLTTQEESLRHSGLAERILLLDADWPSIAAQPASPPEYPAASSNLAYVIYTSGSTGRPKGVAIEHGSLINLVAWQQRQYRFTGADRATQIAAPGFDASVWEIWACLTSGASLHIPPDELRRSPSQLIDWLVREQITIAFLPTPLAEAVLDAPWPAGGSLRLLTTGGDELHRRPGAGHPFQLVNVYGPTENTVASTVAVVAPAELDDTRPSIGRPIANTHAYVLDRNMNPVPMGTPGELYLGGAGLARGYLGRPELTAERFVPNPFAARPGKRLYKTGDLARWLPDGQIEFLGRIDHQLKIRGYRIELGEIETVLGEHDAVAQAAVAAWPDRGGQSRLAAYVVPRQGRTAPAVILREYLQRRLPEYMVPSALVAMDRLPLNPNGKVDRSRLPEPESSHLERQYVAPRTPSEQLLAGIWQKVLGVDRVGASDNFFELGGHSLSAMRMMAEVEAATGVQLPLRDLFQHGTVEKLAEAIGGQQTRSVQLPLVQIQAGGGDRPLFVVHPAEGVVVAYAAVAQRLKTSQPFYGLQAPGLEDEAAPLDGVETMASHYVEAIRTVQPHGPYLLAGWSFGGLVAFEMAQQLQATGDQVAWLALLDSFILSRGGGAPHQDEGRMFASGAKQYLEQLGLDLPIAEDELARHAPSEQVEIILARLAETGNELPEAMTRQARNLLRIWDINAAAGRRYVPQPYEGEVAFFRAADDESAAGDSLPDPVGQWQEVLARPLEIHRVPGTHTSMILDPRNVGVLAERLQACLDNLRTTPPTD
ncbi:MAG: amino acid adenylation domain-containing protein, partial [Pirellulales bacterium]|nr:amino acid adenylation domain-containing protein [Pirellulales bacterium]